MIDCFGFTPYWQHSSQVTAVIKCYFQSGVRVIFALNVYMYFLLWYNSLRQVINLTLSCTHVLLITKGDDPVKRIITYDIYFGRLDPPEPAVVMHALIRNQVKEVYHSCMDSYLVSQRDALRHLLFVFF